MNENSCANVGEDVGENAHQTQGQNRSLNMQQEQMQNQYDGGSTIIHEDIVQVDSASRGGRRREILETNDHRSVG